MTVSIISGAMIKLKPCRLLVVLCISLLAGCISTVSDTLMAKQRLDSIASTVWQRALDHSPHLRLKAGLPVTEIPDITYEAALDEANFSKTMLVQLSAIPINELTHEDWLTWDMLRSHLEFKVKGVDYYWLQFSVTPYNGGGLLGSVNRIIKAVVINTPEDSNIYLGLINEYTELLDQMTAKLEGQESRGILVPQPAIPAILSLFKAYRNDALDTLSIDESRLTNLDSKTKASFISQIEQAVNTQAIPAFNRLIDYLGPDYQRRAPETVGLYQYPGGKQYYRHLVKHYTLPDETPKSLFDYGQQRIEEITAQMKEIRLELGFQGSEAEFHQMLRTNHRFLAKNSDEVEQRYNQYIRRIEPLISKYFFTKPDAPYGVKRLDLAQEVGMTFGYYEGPTLENPVGHYRYNGSKLNSRSLISAGHLIYHELIPGHHFQFSLQKENKHIPVIRRELLGSAGFGEGWAEYGASLAVEMGLLDDPYDRYGHLLFEMFLTVRLVVDPSMNYFGWSLQQARDYMKQHLFLSDLQIASDSLRYSTDWPGQALSYKIGHRTIFNSRAEAKQKLGDSFDIRAFHQVVIGSGALQLNTLKKHVDRYVERST